MAKLVRVAVHIEQVREGRWDVRVDIRHYGETAMSRHLGMYNDAWAAAWAAEEYMSGVRQTLALSDEVDMVGKG